MNVENNEVFSRKVNRSLSPSVITSKLTLAPPLVKSEVPTAIKILRYSRDEAPWTFIDGYQHFADTFSLRLKGRRWISRFLHKIFYHTIFQSTFLTDVTCTSGFFQFTHCSYKLPLFPTAETDSPPTSVSSQRTNGESEEQNKQQSLEYASAEKSQMGNAVMKGTATLSFIAVIVRPAIWMYNFKK